MMARLKLLRCGPLTTVQDAGRIGMLRHGVSASGPMDQIGFAQAGRLVGASGFSSIEFATGGLAVEVIEGQLALGWAGGDFTVVLDGKPLDWPGRAELKAGQVLEIGPGAWGNFGYLRFGGDIDLPATMGSIATSTRVKFGGFEGRALMAGDELAVIGEGREPVEDTKELGVELGPIRFIWGIHALNFPARVRERFLEARFVVTSAMDRMGFRLSDPEGVFENASFLSLVSEPVLPGDVQILGDGTPIVLMRDHQPTGGYPRIATVIRADLDRLAQMRPGAPIVFEAVTVEHAQKIWRSRAL